MQTKYTIRMFIHLHNLLFTAPVRGLLWTVALFSLCFFGAHFCKLALLGWQKSQPVEEKKEEVKEEKKAPAKPQEPVYYIVERKTRRAKSSYGEPKEIHFK